MALERLSLTGSPTSPSTSPELPPWLCPESETPWAWKAALVREVSRATRLEVGEADAGCKAFRHCGRVHSIIKIIMRQLQDHHVWVPCTESVGARQRAWAPRRRGSKSASAPHTRRCSCRRSRCASSLLAEKVIQRTNVYSEHWICANSILTKTSSVRL